MFSEVPISASLTCQYDFHQDQCIAQPLVANIHPAFLSLARSPVCLSMLSSQDDFFLLFLFSLPFAVATLCRANRRARIRFLFAKHANLLSPSRNLTPSTRTRSRRSEAFHCQQEIFSTTTSFTTFSLPDPPISASGLVSSRRLQLAACSSSSNLRKRNSRSFGRTVKTLRRACGDNQTVQSQSGRMLVQRSNSKTTESLTAGKLPTDLQPIYICSTLRRMVCADSYRVHHAAFPTPSSHHSALQSITLSL